MAFVLEQLADHKDANFVLACRSADWKGATEMRIREIWGTSPTIGKLLPLGPDEIGLIARSSLPRSQSNGFLRAANRDGMSETLGNPQHLSMLMDAVRNDGWPSSKARLYRSACEMLVSEANETHPDHQPADQPSGEELLDCAGFVFAQLLLSGNPRVRLRRGEDTIPTASRLAGGGIAERLVRRCLGTRLFARTGDGAYEPCHRMITEFLAARWLSEAVGGGKLSARDVETVMCVQGERVPGALRGLHAWLATQCASKNLQWLADRLIKRDPYGFWCFGDRSELGDASAVKLLGALAETQDENPHSHSREGSSPIGDWPTGPALQEHVIALLGDKSTSPAMIALLVDSVKGSAFTRRVDDKLAEIVLDEDSRVEVRIACLNRLAGRDGRASIDGMVRDLAKQGIDSLSVAVDGMRAHTSQLAADTIAGVLVAAGTQERHLGMGQHGVEDSMTEAQLRGCLGSLTRLIEDGKPHDAVVEARRWIIRLLGRLLEMDAAPDARAIWDLLRKSSVHQQREDSWHRRSRKYFEEHTQVRRAVQEQALRSMCEIDPWARPRDIARVSPGLSLSKEDLAHHLGRIGKPGQKGEAGLWRDLVLLGLASGHGEIVEQELARARMDPDLRDATMEIEKVRNALRAQEAPRVAKPAPPEAPEWRRQLANKRDGIARGEHLGLLMHAANACLGPYVADDANGGTCRERLLSFVGADLVGPVTEGLRLAATKAENRKSPRELAESRARWEIDPYAAVLKAHCHLQVADGKDLAHLDPETAKSALAAQHLAPGWHREGTRREIIGMLEPVVYTGKRQKARHIRDITEPMLDTEEDGIAGVALLDSDEQLSDVAGPIALEWLERRPRLRDATFWALLATAAKRLGKDKAAKFVREHMPRATGTDQPLRERMMAAAFALDLPGSQPELASFAKEDRGHFWVLRDSLQQLRHRDLDSDWSIEQSRFMVSMHAASWPNVSHPGGMLVRGRHPWLAASFLQARIDSLGGNPSPAATAALEDLAKTANLGDYSDLVKAAQHNQRRLRFEEETNLLGLAQVRGVLLRKAPANHRHLREMVLEKLAGIQERIKEDDTSRVEAYWNESTPKPEGQCRDRIKDALEESFSGPDNFNIAAEALTPDRGRSDLLCKHKGAGPAIAVQIEVRGQQHPKLWRAAATQPGEHMKAHGANRAGIYLVLWFGPEHRLSVPQGMPHPKSAQGLKKALDKWHTDMPHRPETFVLDLSHRHGRGTAAKAKATRKTSRRQAPPARAKRPESSASVRKARRETPNPRPRSAKAPVAASPQRTKEARDS